MVIKARALFLLPLLFCVCAPCPAAAAESAPEGRRVLPEYQVKAAFLLNFARFVDWPAPLEPGRRFAIGVLGEDPFGDILDRTAAGQLIGDREVVIRRSGRLEELSDCRIVFISASESDSVRDILERLKGRSVLTVGDMDGFAEGGGIIGLVLRGKSVRFEINTEAAAGASLKISSQLLNLARVINRAR